MTRQSATHPAQYAEYTAALFIPQAAAFENVSSAHFLLHSQQTSVETA